MTDYAVTMVWECQADAESAAAAEALQGSPEVALAVSHGRLVTVVYVTADRLFDAPGSAAELLRPLAERWGEPVACSTEPTSATPYFLLDHYGK
jgi:hypothetical protein